MRRSSARCSCPRRCDCSTGGAGTCQAGSSGSRTSRSSARSTSLCRAPAPDLIPDLAPFDLDRFLADLAALADDGTDHRYGGHPEQWAELRLPEEGDPRGVAVVLHGGFWRAEFTLATTRATATDLARRRGATGNVEYRRIGAGGGVPETLEDVVAAVRAIPVSASRVVAIGHSAGGQLALWLASTGLLTAAVSLGGVCDLREGARLGVGDGAVAAFVRDADLAPVDPMQRLPTGVPQLLVHGNLDDRVPVELS